MSVMETVTRPALGVRGRGGTAEGGPDFVLKDQDFNALRRLASEYSGIMLPEGKRAMVRSRLAKRLRVLKLGSFADYRARLERGDAAEFIEFINCLTTNLTYFFRESHHFEHMTEVSLPARIAWRHERGQRKLRIWSSASSTGEEPYSIMMTLLETMSQLPSWDVEVLATDLDTRVLETASAGVYSDERVNGMDPAKLKRWFFRGTGALAGKVKVKPELQRKIEFRQFNLVKPWTMPEPFDIIFCRNVVIYFDKPTQRELFARMSAALLPGGYLYLGHSETLFGVSDEFRLVGKSLYRKPAADEEG